MKTRREAAQSNILSFLDAISCGFGAVLLLFILTAKAQVTESEEEARQSRQAAETLQAAIRETEAKQKALDQEIEALDPQPDTNATSTAQLAAEQERLAKAVEDQAQALAALETEAEPTREPAALDRPSADQSYLSGLRLRGPKAVILLESSGSMLASNAQSALQIIQQGDGATSEKWLRAKAALRAVIAAIPKGTEVAVFAMGEATTPSPEPPRIPTSIPTITPPYSHSWSASIIWKQAAGPTSPRGLATVNQLPQRASSLLLIGDGLPTAPAPQGGNLSEMTASSSSNAPRPTAPTLPSTPSSSPSRAIPPPPVSSGGSAAAPAALPSSPTTIGLTHDKPSK